MELLLVPDEGELAGEAATRGEGNQAPLCQPIRHREAGDEGDAEPLLHRQHHRLQGIELYPRLPAGQVGLELLLELLAAAGLRLAQHPGFPGKPAQGQLELIRQGVTGGGDDEHLVLQPGFAHQVRVVVLPLDEGEIQFEVGEGMAQEVGVGDGDPGGGSQLLGPLRQQGGQQVVADGLAGPEVQLAARLGIGAEELLYLLHPGQQLLGGRLQQAPLAVELKPRVHPIEQGRGELALQLLQRLGDGPLAQAEFIGGAPQVAVAGDGGKHLELLQGELHIV